MMVETSVGLPASDVRVVRDLAARLAEFAALPVQAARVRERDISTCRGDPGRLWEWCEIAERTTRA